VEIPAQVHGWEWLREAELTARGLLGDRAYALIDVETNKVVSAKSVRLFPGVLDCRAAFVRAAAVRAGAAPVSITLPSGQAVRTDSPDAGPTLSAHFGREVMLARSAPEDFTIDQYHPDIEGADPDGRRDTVVEQKLGSAYFSAAGKPSPCRLGRSSTFSPCPC